MISFRGAAKFVIENWVTLRPTTIKNMELVLIAPIAQKTKLVIASG